MNGEQSVTGASSVASAKSQYPLGLTTPTNQFTQNSSNNTKSAAMAGSAFLSQSSTFHSAVGSQAPFHMKQSAHPFDRDATTKPIGTPFGTTPSPPGASSVLIRQLPLNTSEEQLRLMAVWSKELVSVEVLPIEQSSDSGFRSAIMNFKSPAGAHEAKSMLDGKSNIANDADMIVEILADTALSTSSTASSSAASSTVNSRQPSRFKNGGAFQSLDNISPPLNGGAYVGTELPTPESSAMYQNLFSPQSPIGNHLTEPSRMSGKSLIKSNDAADDDETGELLKDPVAYAENGATAQRRATAPQIPISRMAGLSLSTTAPSPSSLPQFGHPRMGGIPTHPSAMSPLMTTGSGRPMNFPLNPHYPRHNFPPPVNPADQNPPCNTLYVGNLPIDTSEEELKAIFSKQRGYKRLCFRTKQNGPMCFVEFEDVSFATKALHELYGQPLHNSVKGGIRLSFSKNPLGVRSGQTSAQASSSSMSGLNGMTPGPSNGFTTANGPPPGLSVPPGLATNRVGGYNGGPGAGPHGYNTAGLSSSGHGWGTPGYNPAMAAGGSSSNLQSGSSNYLPPHMMGL
ncbi:hypothetical protein jhhlp_001419 [Lomentospora prolificans]|uniref:RRM domain-containing protein n=1 Tax=Lomentospora prolificans TaxID=41688 RepID=A0A2N3NI86_9PEZI|nr:hypothetical protein jhhlp_001419 [Lomentospora prolificans]